MIKNKHKHVDSFGTCYLPYLSGAFLFCVTSGDDDQIYEDMKSLLQEASLNCFCAHKHIDWRAETCHLLHLTHALKTMFAEDPPVRAKPPAQPSLSQLHPHLHSQPQPQPQPQLRPQASARGTEQRINSEPIISFPSPQESYIQPTHPPQPSLNYSSHQPLVRHASSPGNIQYDESHLNYRSPPTQQWFVN